MELFTELHPKLETVCESVASCRFCLTPESAARLIRRDLTAFYVCFRDCGLGLQIMEPIHYNWVCQYCWVRASQCVKFIECARKSEHLLNNVLRHEEITEEKLSNVCTNYIVPPVTLSTCVPLTTFYDTTIEDPANFDRFVNIFSVAPGSSNDLMNLLDVSMYYETPPDQAEYYGGRESVEAPAVAGLVKIEKKAVNRKGSNVKKPKMRRPRKDPAELLAKWRELQVQVINLSEEEQLQEIAERRRAMREREWKYHCDKCAVGFHEEESIDKHNEVHDKARGPYECNICLVRFAKQHQLSSHMGGHRRRWRCLRCGETIFKSAYLAPHHAKCTGSAPVTCDQCGKFYSNNLRLRKHVSKSHNAKRKYMCDVCGRAFREKQQIKYHMRVHTREMPFACDICGKRSATSTSHRMHMMVHTSPEIKTPELYCVECDRYFKNKYILRIHFKQSLKHVSRDTFRHACGECDERFPGASALRVHTNTAHLKQRTHPCAACDRAYYTQSALTAHVKEKHEARARSRDHVCAACNRSFVTSSQLKAHSRMHTKERPYACLLCPATFSFNSALYTHNKLRHKMTTAEMRTKLGVKKL